MEQLSESQSIFLTYLCIPIFAVAFFLNHALVEGYTWTIPGAILGSIGALAFTFGIFNSDPVTRQRLAIGSSIAFLTWMIILLSLNAFGVGRPGPNIIADLYLREVNSVFLNVVLTVGSFSWITYLGEKVVKEYGWGANPESEKLDIEVDEHGIPLQDQFDNEEND